MRWRGRRQSANVEDRRGRRAVPAAAGGGLGLLLIVGIGLFLGVDANTLLQVVQTTQRPGASSAPVEGRRGPLEDEQAQFVAVVLADTEDTWTGLFRQGGLTYREPTLVLFSGATRSALWVVVTNTFAEAVEALSERTRRVAAKRSMPPS